MKLQESPPSRSLDPSVGTNGSKYRTTVVMAPNVGDNLDLFSFKSGRSKNDIIEEAVIHYLERNDMKPQLKPKIKVDFSY